MRADVFSLSCPALDSLAFVGWKGTEHVSRPYEIELYFTVPAGAPARKAVGERATLKADRGSGDPLVWHGVIASVRLLHTFAERALYKALLVPKLWMLRHSMRSHVFTHETVKQFLSDTLVAGGLATSEFRFSVDEGRYPEEELVVQYRETHLDFFHRWLEREGLYYYFEHADGAPGEVLVIVDDASLHDDFPGGGRARHVPVHGHDATAPTGLHQLEQDVAWLPKSVTVTDYNYANPSAPVLGESRVTEHGMGVLRDYGHRVFVEGEAKRLAEVRAQSIGCREVTLRASGDVLGPRPGYRLAIDDRPEEVTESWLALEVSHVGTISGATAEMRRLTGLGAGETYRMSLVAIPAETQFRAAQSTPWPRIYGFENAIVCGPATSQYAQLDADGRYFVRFEFDASELEDGKASTRVRMMQPHGGATEGFHFPLRKGTEVMIGFLGGDPDRPFIAGVVPNAHKPSVVGERNHTQNVVRTGSGNQIVLEDEQGKEFIFVHTPNKATGIYLGVPTGQHTDVYTGEGKTTTGTFSSPVNAIPTNPDVIIERDVTFSFLNTTEGSYGLWVGGDAWENVLADKYLWVGGDTYYGLSGTYDLLVGSTANETYYATRTTTIKTGRTDTVEAGGMTQDLTDFLHQGVHGSGWQHVDADWEHKVTGTATDDYGTWSTKVGQTWTANVGSGITITCTGGSVTITSASGNVNINAPAGKVSITSPTVEHNTEALQHKSSSFQDWYKYKGATGILKTDHAAIYQSAYGLKIDTVAAKMDTTAAKKEDRGLKSTVLGAYIKQQAAAAISGGIQVFNHAMSKL
jgi:type VI secretion system secreted protein VgrG